MTNKAGFTPGPWHLHDMEHATVVGPDHIAIALCEASSRDDEENMANSRLIAAAPDLLEACRDAIDQITRQPRWEDPGTYHTECKNRQWILDTLESAIAKAEGKEATDEQA